MERVRLMCWCRHCVSGLHLPAYAAAEGGLFAEQGLEVEFIDCVTVPERGLRGYGTTLKALAGEQAEFALSSVAYLLAARSEAETELGARFAAVFHQRNPIAAMVAADSDLHQPEDLPGRRTASATGNWFVREYAGALAHMGFGAPDLVEPPEDVHAALREGDIDVIPAWVDMLPGYSKQGPVRAVALDFEVYATGLVAGDRLPLELVLRMRDALAAGYELQREQPELGIAAFRRHCPQRTEEHLRIGWSAIEPYVFDGRGPGSMDAERWRATIDYTVAAHGLSASAPEQVYRPELLAPALAHSAT
ncbi:MAG: ABC transporter substrate-binding protein [Actinomycetota bacterium]|nr:ABC transporter substrate-binding protein [Actinomycetota bacterium]